ncbi:type IV pilus biogenesis/stability protein PilW [Actinobacillus porcitonsillarum]|uniref:Type IV pilus biogenesis/stability protein PilW n=1 Tax=Actinobacillus porcitonsillarum TaxID=189834 RepID=A0A2U8FIV9_9PAST|nr:type IV pilus biogenesis/stability protein PilW [Actinobacillus porcitonsillarum]AWI50895.1 type IV pilus biogenesis/stability protein PilW [Actinobacillus porcitonsillarum]
MPFAKLFNFFTACLVLFLVGCSSTVEPISEFNRSEAVKARINLALAYLDHHDFPKAKENIDRALSHDPKDYLPYSVLAYYYQQTGEPQQAEKAYLDALTLSHNRPDVLNNYGTFLCKQGQFQQAYQQFEKAVSSEQPYYHQADSLENIILCAKSESNLAKVQEAINQLEKLDKVRANQLR